MDYFFIALYRHHVYDFLAIKLYTQNTMYAMIMSRHMNLFFFTDCAGTGTTSNSGSNDCGSGVNIVLVIIIVLLVIGLVIAIVVIVFLLWKLKTVKLQ